MVERLFRCTQTVPASAHCLCRKTSRNSIMEKHSSLEDGLWEMVYRDPPSLHHGFIDLKLGARGSCCSDTCERLLPVWAVFCTDPDIHSSALYSSSARAKWLTPFLSFITAAPEISGQSASKFSARGQMVEGHHQRKLCLAAAIVVVCSPAVWLADRQRAVASFQSASLIVYRLMSHISLYLSDKN